MGVGRLSRAWAALIAVVLLGGCTSLFPERDAALPIADLDLDPKPGRLELETNEPLGPVTEVVSGAVSGEEFTLTLYRTVDGFCLELSAHQDRGSACGPPPGEGLPQVQHFGPISQSGLQDGTIELDGTVTSDVESLWVVTDEGTRAHAVLVPADFGGTDGSVFVVFLPEGLHPVRVVAADADAEILDELPIVSVAPGGPGAPPQQGS